MKSIKTGALAVVVVFALVGCSGGGGKSDAEQAVDHGSRIVFPDGSEARLEIVGYLTEEMRGCELVLFEPDEIEVSKVDRGTEDPEGGEPEPTVVTLHVRAVPDGCE